MNFTKTSRTTARVLAFTLSAALSGLATAADLYVESAGVGIGTNTPGRLLHVKGSDAVFRMDRPVDSAAFMLVRTDANGNPLKTFVVGANATAANAGEFVINDLGAAVSGAGTRRMTLTSAGEAQFTGTVRAPAFVQTSSARFKTDIQPIAHATDIIQQIDGVRFNWKADNAPSVGVIAEQVQKVLPELVQTDDAGQASAVNYSAMIAVLIQAVKEQQQTISAQQQQLQQLQARMEHASFGQPLPDAQKLGQRVDALKADDLTATPIAATLSE